MTRHSMKHLHPEEKKANLGFYNSRNPTIETDIEYQRMTMYCPRCRKTVNQNKSFTGYKASGQNPCSRCSKCGLIHDSKLYKHLLQQINQ